MNIILLGPPGAGKGTQAKIIEQKYNIPQISTGDILRGEIKSKSKEGLKIKDMMSSGKLLPDEFIIEILKKRITNKDCNNGFMLDGVPRTIEQAKMIQKLNIKIDYIVEIVADEKNLIERITGRRIHEPSGRSYHIKFNPPLVEGKDDETNEDLVQRSDDHEEVIKKRIEIYKNQTACLTDFYNNMENSNIKHLKINGDQPVNNVTKDIFTFLNS